MNHKHQVHKNIGLGLILIFVIGSVLWVLFPEKNYSAIPFLGLYALPLFFSITMVVFKRYSDSELIRGAYSNDDAIGIEKAIIQNNLEQTLVSVMLVMSFGAITDTYFSKLIPIHLVLFLIGRFAFTVGYRISPMHRLTGFVISHYANLILLLMSAYVYLTNYGH